jgi:hypothetical protein
VSTFRLACGSLNDRYVLACGSTQRPGEGAEAEAAARAAEGSASMICATALSSWAAETNHASNTDGGSDTPESSMARKNGG